MRLVASYGLGFLLAVLWFDLMFDVQVRPHRSERDLPDAVLTSIASYYRRVTTDARPMNQLVALAMLTTLGSLIGEVVGNPPHRIAGGVALAFAGSAISIAGARTVRNAVRLGWRADATTQQSALARSIYHDHCACLLLVVVALVAHMVVAS